MCDSKVSGVCESGVHTALMRCMRSCCLGVKASGSSLSPPAVALVGVSYCAPAPPRLFLLPLLLLLVPDRRPCLPPPPLALSVDPALLACPVFLSSAAMWPMAGSTTAASSSQGHRFKPRKLPMGGAAAAPWS